MSTVKLLFRILLEFEYRCPKVCSQQSLPFYDCVKSHQQLKSSLFSSTESDKSIEQLKIVFSSLPSLARYEFNLGLYSAASCLSTILHLPLGLSRLTANRRNVLQTNYTKTQQQQHLATSSLNNNNSISNSEGGGEAITSSGPAVSGSVVIEPLSSSPAAADVSSSSGDSPQYPNANDILSLRFTVCRLLGLVDLSAPDAQPLCRALIRCLEILVKDPVLLLLCIGVPESEIIKKLPKRLFNEDVNNPEFVPPITSLSSSAIKVPINEQQASSTASAAALSSLSSSQQNQQEQQPTPLLASSSLSAGQQQNQGLPATTAAAGGMSSHSAPAAAVPSGIESSLAASSTMPAVSEATIVVNQEFPVNASGDLQQERVQEREREFSTIHDVLHAASLHLHHPAGIQIATGEQQNHENIGIVEIRSEAEGHLDNDDVESDDENGGDENDDDEDGDDDESGSTSSEDMIMDEEEEVR